MSVCISLLNTSLAVNTKDVERVKKEIDEGTDLAHLVDKLFLFTKLSHINIA